MLFFSLMSFNPPSKTIVSKTAIQLKLLIQVVCDEYDLFVDGL